MWVGYDDFRAFFSMPVLLEQISMILDTSVSESYIEDCETCCNPIQITTQFINNELQVFEAINIEQ